MRKAIRLLWQFGARQKSAPDVRRLHKNLFLPGFYRFAGKGLRFTAAFLLVVANIFLHRNSAKQAQKKGNGVEPFLTWQQGGIP